MVLPFSHDEVMDNPRVCQQELLHVMGKLFSRESVNVTKRVNAKGRDVLRFMAGLASPVKPVEIERGLGFSYHSCHTTLASLREAKLIHQASGQVRTRTYVLDKDAYQYLL